MHCDTLKPMGRRALRNIEQMAPTGSGGEWVDDMSAFINSHLHVLLTNA